MERGREIYTEKYLKKEAARKNCRMYPINFFFIKRSHKKKELSKENALQIVLRPQKGPQIADNILDHYIIYIINYYTYFNIYIIS